MALTEQTANQYQTDKSRVIISLSSENDLNKSSEGTVNFTYSELVTGGKFQPM